MSDKSVLERLRHLLLGVVAFIFVGTVFELILIGHNEETLQWIPFLASSAGILSVAIAWFNPNAITVTVLRWVMAIVALISILGMYLHFSGNLAFTREINPSYSLGESIWPAMKGSYPLLAPGILFLAGILGIAATYKHPVIES